MEPLEDAAAALAAVDLAREEVSSPKSSPKSPPPPPPSSHNIYSFPPPPPGRGSYTQASYGPPAAILEMGTFMHASEGEMVCESINPKIPYFNAPIFLENKTTIGKVDEVLGPINQVYFTVKPQQGIQATSFKVGDKVFIGGDKLLPLEKWVSSVPSVLFRATLLRMGTSREELILLTYM